MGIGNGVRSNRSYTSYTIPLFLPVAVPLAAGGTTNRHVG